MAAAVVVPTHGSGSRPAQSARSVRIEFKELVGHEAMGYVEIFPGLGWKTDGYGCDEACRWYLQAGFVKKLFL